MAWNLMEWSTEQDQLVPVEGERMSLQQAHETVKELHSLAQKPGLILRFHALKALARVETREGGAVVPWKMVIGHREKDAGRMYELMQRLCHSGITQLILMRTRPATMRRSPLANKVSQLMSGREA